MFTPIIIPNKHAHELRINVNLISKKLKFSRFIDFFIFNKKPWKSWRKTIHHEPVHVG